MAIVQIKKRTSSTWITLPDPSEMTVTDELVWAPNTGRTSSGTMVGDLKGVKMTVECKWNLLTETQMSSLRTAVRSAGGFFNLRYYDLGETHTMVCYASGIPRKLYSHHMNYRYYQDVTISFIEK